MIINPPEIKSINNEPIKITITFPSHVYSISGIRDFTKNLTQNLTGFSEQWSYRFQSLIDELCNNAVEHGSAPGEPIVITFVLTGKEKLEFYIDDSNTGKNKTNATELENMYKNSINRNPDNFNTIRGRGLSHIVSRLSDEIYFKDLENGGLRVGVIKNLNNH